MVSKDTASKTFHELMALGFITLAEESDWFNGEAREYRLTWMSMNGREPTDEWASVNVAESGQKDGQPERRPPSRTDRPVRRTVNRKPTIQQQKNRALDANAEPERPV